jgi:hypothetical protein
MGEVIDFAVEVLARKKQSEKPATVKSESQCMDQDPYYLFICNVLNTADSCGFELPFTLDSAAKHVYEKTRHTSQLAKLLKKTKN